MSVAKIKTFPQVCHNMHVITNRYKLADKFNEYYTYTVKKIDGTKPLKLRVSSNLNDCKKFIEDTIESGKNYPSILEIKEKF